MLKVNLLPPAMRPKMVINLDIIVLGIACLSMIGVAFLYLNVSAKSKQIKQELSRLEKDRDEQKKLFSKLQQQDSKRDLSATQALVAKRRKWHPFIKEFTYILPQDVWINKINMTPTGDGVGLTFSGYAPSQKSVNRFLSRMERSQAFAAVRLNTSKRREDFTPVLYSFDFSVPDVFAAESFGFSREPAGAAAEAAPAKGKAKKGKKKK